MKNLKEIINTNLRRLCAAMMVLILLIAVFLQITAAQNQARINASAAFLQISQLLRQNEVELSEVEAAYRETCLLNAETIAYMIQTDPGILGNVPLFRELAAMLQVDEIHIFDETGRIFTGSHPEYYDFTFDSGEQMNFFKPMLSDKTLRLCQDITPNTAEGKLVQYSALWSSDEQFIVQVGMYPDAVLKATEKNELSYIFSLLQGSPGISLYAVDPASARILGSSSGADTGKTLSQLGLSMEMVKRERDGHHLMVNGVNSFCIFHDADGMLLGYVISNDQLYSNIVEYTLVLVICLLLIAAVLVKLMQRLTNQYIVNSIAAINRTLRSIGAGNLDMRMDVRSSQEFSELSDHINQMVHSLLANTDKLSFVLNRTNLRIGVYEYNTAMKNVRFTEHIPQIFGLSAREMKKLAADQNRLKAFVEQVRQESIPERENTYRFMGKREKYLSLEEVTKGSDVLGIVIDVTDEMSNLKLAQTERDTDLLTGLLNRRGMMRRLEALFASGKEVGHGAVVTFDADGLKEVNDTYGHLTGDHYLKRMAQMLQSFESPQSFAGRMGGDEFLLMVHGYETQQEVEDAMTRLRFLQNHTALQLENGCEVPVRFSFGYVLTLGRTDYEKMLTEADAYMYNVKRIRKQAEKTRREKAES